MKGPERDKAQGEFFTDWRTDYLTTADRPPVAALPVFALLLARGLLLWLVIPIGFLTWVVAFPLFLHRHVSLGRFIGWLDLNLGVSLLRGPFRLFFPRPLMNWVPVHRMPATTHRVRLLTDLF